VRTCFDRPTSTRRPSWASCRSLSAPGLGVPLSRCASGMSPWDHQGVAFGSRAAIKEGQCQFILSDNMISQLAGDDLTENAPHGPRLPRRSGTQRSGDLGRLPAGPSLGDRGKGFAHFALGRSDLMLAWLATAAM
jgi:hypothetical protein